MGEMLAQIARFHDDEVARCVDWFTARVRAGADGGARPRHRRRRGPHVHADLRAGREHQMTSNRWRREHGRTRVVDAPVGEALRIAGDRRSTQHAAPQTPAFDLHALRRGRAPRLRRAARRRRRAARSCCGDPFDLDTQDWVEERIARAVPLPPGAPRATSPPTSRSRRRRCARWTACARRHVRRTERDGAAARIFVRDASARPTARWCAWCNSTLYDALKAGASDIHLETQPQRPDDQVPHRRRADARRDRCRAPSSPSR